MSAPLPKYARIRRVPGRPADVSTEPDRAEIGRRLPHSLRQRLTPVAEGLGSVTDQALGSLAVSALQHGGQVPMSAVRLTPEECAVVRELALRHTRQIVWREAEPPREVVQPDYEKITDGLHEDEIRQRLVEFAARLHQAGILTDEEYAADASRWRITPTDWGMAAAARFAQPRIRWRANAPGWEIYVPAGRWPCPDGGYHHQPAYILTEDGKRLPSE